MSRQEYILFKRRLPGGVASKTWYVEYWDEDGGRYVDRRSTGERRKDRATDKAIEWLESGPPQRRRRSITVADYVGHFWDDESDYVQMKRKRKSGKGISLTYTQNMQRAVKQQFLPWLKDSGNESLPLQRFRAHHLEEYQIHLASLAAKSTNPGRWVNGKLQAVTVALNRAARLGLIDSSPATTIDDMEETPGSRGIMSLEDAARFFKGWGDVFHRTLNLTAAYSGLRLGEIRALLPEHLELQTIGAVLVPVIHVIENYVTGDGRKHPKYDSRRDVPIPEFVYNALQDQIKSNPWGGGPIFWSTKRDIPVSTRAVGEAFRGRKKALKITSDKIVFHSWRHWYNSYMRSTLDDRVLRELTRHRSDELTDRYTHLTDEQRVAVVTAAAALRKSGG